MKTIIAFIYPLMWVSIGVAFVGLDVPISRPGERFDFGPSIIIALVAFPSAFIAFQIGKEK